MCARTSPLLSVAVLAAMLAACQEQPGARALAHSENRQPTQADPERLGRDSAELHRLASLPVSTMVERLGPLRLATAVEVTAEAGSGASETLAEQVGVEMARGGAYHAELLNSHDRGLEAFSIQGQLYVRLRYGELLRRRPQGDEAARLLETMHSRLFAPLELLGRFLRCVPAGDQELAGRPVRRFRLELATPPSPAVGEEGVAQRRWRQELHVTAASGELLVDARSFVLLRLKLAAAYQAPRSGQMISSRLQLNHQIEPLAEDPVLQPPPAVALDPRPRPALELRELLEGLVAPR